MLRPAAFRAGLVALAVASCPLSGCFGPPSGRDVIAQARPGGRVAFDIVKIDPAVVRTLRTEKPLPFGTRFVKYTPPSALRIAVGDTVSVVIWEAGQNGLFAAARPELPAAMAADLAALGGSAPPQADASAPEQNAETGMLGSLLAAMREQDGADAPSDGDSTDENLTGENLAAEGSPGRSNRKRPGTVEERMRGSPGSRATAPALASVGGGTQTRIPDQMVGPDGAITIPYAGRVKVAGLSPDEVQQKIEAALASRAINPQVLVLDRRSPANSITVADEALGGKRVQLPLGGARLLQVIAAAGGTHAPPYQTFVRLSRGAVTATVPLAALIADPSQDIFARPGDVLTLVHRRQTFSVFGATGKNRQIAFDSQHLSLSEALGKAGGLLDKRADSRAVFLFRYEPDTVVRALHQPVATDAPRGISPVAYRLDLHDAASFLLAQRFPVRDHDVIFVANAESVPVYQVLTGLSKITGPVVNSIIVCQSVKC